MAPVVVRRLLLLRYIMSRRHRKAVVRRWILQYKGNEAMFNRYRYRPVLSYRPGTFNLDDYDDIYCKEHMRFTKTEIRQFLPYLRLDQVAFRNRCIATPEVAICLVLWRLSYPSRYKDTQDLFGHSKAWQSTVFNDTIIHLVERFRTMLFWDPKRLTIDKL
jgi:hypothetical protein